MFGPTCRHALYDMLDNRNPWEWELLKGMWWDGIPWLATIGWLNWFSFPVKMLIFAIWPESKPHGDFEYMIHDFHLNFWYNWLAYDMQAFLPYSFLTT